MGSSLWMSWAATVWHAFSCCSLGKESSCSRSISYALSIICLFLCMANFVARMNFLVLYTTFTNSEYFVEYPCSLTKLGQILHMHFDRTQSSCLAVWLQYAIFVFNVPTFITEGVFDLRDITKTGLILVFCIHLYKSETGFLVLVVCIGTRKNMQCLWVDRLM